MITGIITILVIRLVMHGDQLKMDLNQPHVTDWVCSLSLNLCLNNLRVSLITPLWLAYKQHCSLITLELTYMGCWHLLILLWRPGKSDRNES